MPVRHRDLGDELAPTQPKRCRHCDESQSSCGGSGGSSSSSEGRESWRVTLDHDLVETLSAIYPEWFKPRLASPAPDSPRTPRTPRTPLSDDALSWCADSEMAGRAGSSGSAEAGGSPPRVSPPKVVVDDSPLQPAMGKHKESLKVKLMMRRPINQLVEQGIMPPLKTPPAYFEQCRQLERAKTGDLLKAKIQQRPDRRELEQRNILEEEHHVDPSLAEKQRMLKKARLADHLNDQLSHRPGPLELIQKNILHTEETIETAVKSGNVTFKATSEGASLRPIHPSHYCTVEVQVAPPPPPPPPLELVSPPPPSPPSPPSTLSPASVASPQPQHAAPGKDKKKKKQKQQPKARFKFHEYKGPPSAHKQPSPLEEETPYELLLQQQQLLLQLMLPASPAASVTSDCSDALPPPPPPPPPHPPLAGVAIGAGAGVGQRFEDMKVSDLRAECKRRNLRVSGPKPQLLERLRPYLADMKLEEPRSPAGAVAASPAAPSPRASPAPADAEDIVQSQRRHIEELERKLEASRLQLEAVRRDAAGAAASDQSKRLLHAHLCVSQLRAQLDALQHPPAAARLAAGPAPAYILNGVKVVPIAILPSHVAPAPPPPPPPPLPPPPPPPLPPHDHAEDSQIMDDVLEILAENVDLAPSSVSESEQALSPGDWAAAAEAFSPADALAHDAADELQRELSDIQSGILGQADPHADFTAHSHADDDFFGSLLNGDASRDASGPCAMDVTCDAPERMSTTPLPHDALDHSPPGFDDMTELSLPSFEDEDRHCDFDFKDFGIVNPDMVVDGDNYSYMESAPLSNLFGRGHVPQCDPLLGGVLAPAPRPATKLYSWDRLEYDAT